MYGYMYACVYIYVHSCMRALMYAYVHVQFSHVLSVCMYIQGSQVSLFCEVYVGAVCRKSKTQLLALQANVSDVLGLVTHTYIHIYIYTCIHN